jgi:hypothetical protein
VVEAEQYTLRAQAQAINLGLQLPDPYALCRDVTSQAILFVIYRHLALHVRIALVCRL